LGLGIASATPGPIGTAAGIIDAGIDFANGDVVGGLIGIGTAIPVGGYLFWWWKRARSAQRAASEAAEQAARRARSITPYRDPTRPGYNNGATHIDHAQARSLGGTNDQGNLRGLPAETNLRKGGYEGELKRYEESLRRGGMSRENARSVIQPEIDAMRNTVVTRPMDPRVMDQLPANPLDQGRPRRFPE
jgi:hypothetical protein